MKVIRTYEIKRHRLFQNTLSIPTGEELDPPTCIARISMQCSPSVSACTISGVFEDCNLPQMVDELRQFLKVLETMYNV